jgi:hypothetical protein
LLRRNNFVTLPFYLRSQTTLFTRCNHTS